MKARHALGLPIAWRTAAALVLVFISPLFGCRTSGETVIQPAPPLGATRLSERDSAQNRADTEAQAEQNDLAARNDLGARKGEAEAAGVFHRVKQGETLWAIARAYNLPVEDLVEVNGLEHPELLSVGQLIFVPDDDGLGLPHQTKPVASVAKRRRARASGDLGWPLDEGIILRDYAPSDAVPFDGLLLAAPRGTPVKAAAAGEVIYGGDDGTTLGRMIILRHSGGLLTIYAHLDEVVVARGQKLARGAKVGTVGSTGRSKTPQLHFQVRRGRTPENPLDHLPAP